MDIENLDQLVARKSDIISCSIRTDVPRFYLNEYLKHLSREFIDCVNPMNSLQISRVSLNPKDVKVLSWWSKDYDLWIKEFRRPESILHKYKHTFNFTINGEKCELEPGLTSSLDARLEQLKFLCETFDKNVIKLRFDPIVHYKKSEDAPTLNNLKDFNKIAAFAKSLGIIEITCSFCHPYPKVVSRMARAGLILVTLTHQEQEACLCELTQSGVRIHMCRSEVKYNVPNVGKTKCVDSAAIARAYNIKLTKAKNAAYGKECACNKSRDIGAYTLKCGHKCIYCYV